MRNLVLAFTLVLLVATCAYALTRHDGPQQFNAEVTIAADVTIPAADNLGWTGESGANTACDTTCTLGCIAGFDTGSSVFVACTDATADTCLCS